MMRAEASRVPAEEMDHKRTSCALQAARLLLAAAVRAGEFGEGNVKPSQDEGDIALIYAKCVLIGYLPPPRGPLPVDDRRLRRGPTHL